MAGFGGWAKSADWFCKVQCANLLGPQIIFWHVGETPECTQFSANRDAPAGFLQHLAMQGRDRVFALVNSTAGQLNFWARLHLHSSQQAVTQRQDGIDTGSARVALPCFWRIAIPSDHDFALGAEVALTI